MFIEVVLAADDSRVLINTYRIIYVTREAGGCVLAIDEGEAKPRYMHIKDAFEDIVGMVM